VLPIRPGTLRRAALPALWLIAACSGGSDGERLEGTWGHGDDVNRECIQELIFEAGEFKESTYCLLSTGQIGIEQKGGSYREGDGQVVLSYLRSSCPDEVRHELSLSYDISRSMLSLSTPEYAIGLTRRRRPSTVTGTSVNGCFEEGNTKFAASPLRDL
jgi:hypothetical protein